MNQLPSSHLSFSLSNFEGPLELLLFLIQKEEMDVCSISLKQITQQFFNLEDFANVDTASDFLFLASTLLVMKSRKLLPSESTSDTPEETSRIEMIQTLLEYCRFKELACTLAEREEQQKAFFDRDCPPIELQKRPGLEEVSLAGLSSLLNDILREAASRPQAPIHDEEWQIGPKIEWFRMKLGSDSPLAFHTVFSPKKSREELIVLFLALLELLKLQEIKLIHLENNTLALKKP